MQCEQGVWRSHWGRRWQEGEESAGQEKEFGLTRLDDDDRRKDRPGQTHLLLATVALDAAEMDLETERVASARAARCLVSGAGRREPLGQGRRANLPCSALACLQRRCLQQSTLRPCAWVRVGVWTLSTVLAGLLRTTSLVLEYVGVVVVRFGFRSDEGPCQPSLRFQTCPNRGFSLGLGPRAPFFFSLSLLPSTTTALAGLWD